ncbi:MAG: hypothetical protein A2934_03765 [Candidatus Sungbacteria bacterium RIFCSPLOWO2_01_FULL_47_10]|uniref:Histidine ammonia-lyase n=1 Tax=Candidatus Sungbacteria bacterium RIFCSPLOWO2_01_FULL_47_10 TaxID=1802276 RepID=A0A1G2KZR7_9BACT|nr:MAG: hypothetical protein A2934_03765 [Candidatus Sungbacteria bacterium RIFCSPLOWO2_01_FULL_47_10]
MKRGKTYSVPLWRVSVADFIGAIRRGTRLSVEQESLRRIRSGFDSVKSSLLENKIIYGVNTGIGDLCDKIIPPASLRELQKNIIVSHACGFEPFVDERVSRGVLFLKINSLAKGFSGVSPELVKKLISIFNNGISGLLPARGSLGASGDLIPLAHLGLLLLGKGRAYRGGSVQSSSALLKRAGISPYEFGPKEALALINGTEVLTSSAAHSVNRAENLFETSITATAALYEIFGASRASLDSKLHAQKPHPGQERVATMLRSLLRESVLCEQAQKKIQDAYVFRCAPQIDGAIWDEIKKAREAVEIELNSVTDNPLFFGTGAVSGGNFHAQRLAFAMDSLAISLAAFGKISERRIERLLNPSLSGLPAFLSPDCGIHSGFMITQYLAASLVAENSVLATPASIQSIPVSANQEDFVSMGMTAAWKLERIVANCEQILAVEILALAQAMDLMRRNSNIPLARFCPSSRSFFLRVRNLSRFLARDRVLGDDIRNIAHCIQNGYFIA